MKSLRNRTTNAVLWDLIGMLVQHSGTFIISIFLARLLDPSDFGIIGIALVVINLAQVFVDFGFGSALVQSQKNTTLTYCSIFFFNLFIGFLLSCILYFSAKSIGEFYANDSIEFVIKWLSPLFIFNSLNIVQISILKKELKFKHLAIRTTIASIIGGIVALIMAIFDWGVMSLIAQQLVMSFVGIFLLWRTSKWRPDLKFSISEVRKLSDFSLYVFLDQISSNILRKLDVLVIGKLFSPALLGFYTRSQSFRDLVVKYSGNSIKKVFYPVLSGLQSEEVKFRNIYFNLLSIIVFVSFGLTGFLFLSGRDIIIYLLGAKWETSVLFFQIMILSVSTYPFEAQMVNAFLSKGHSKANFKIGLVRKSLRALPLLLLINYTVEVYLWTFLAINLVVVVINIFSMSNFLGMKKTSHISKILQCMPPVVLFSALYFTLEFDLKEVYHRILLTFTFLISYFIYCWIIGNDGMIHTTKFVRKKIGIN